MPIIVPTTGLYPSMEDVFNATRVHINDTFEVASVPLAGRVFRDDWEPVLQILTLAVQELQDDLEDRGLPTTREVVFIINGLTPINGPSGLGVPDPTIQPFLSFGGYWDGATLNPFVQLPYDCLVPLKIQQRVTGSGTSFMLLPNRVNGLPSVYQNFLMGWWEWRQDGIFFNGSQNTIDIELTYTGGVPKYPINMNPALFPTTLIPYLDSLRALSYKCAYIFCAPRLPKGGADELQANYEAAMIKLANRYIRTMQRTPVCRREFGYDGGPGASGEGWGYQ